MARKRLLPSDREVKRLVDKGMTHTEIGEKFGTTRQAVATALSRAGLTDKHRCSTVPWRVKMGHHTNYNLRMLRAHDRILRGDEISDAERHRHDLWVERLREYGDMVVDYNPDFEEGFYWVPRRPGIDLDVFRVPDVKPKKTVAYIAGLVAPVAPLYAMHARHFVDALMVSDSTAAAMGRAYVGYKYGVV